MYGLPQASRVAYDALVPHLRQAGYNETGITPGLFKHESNSIIFCLTVDDFGIQYVGKEDALHLRDHLAKEYVLTEDWEGKNYCGIDLEWDYVNRHVTLSIDGYVLRGLQRFAHLLDLNTKGKPKRLQHAPSKHTAPKYGAKVQYAKEPDTSEPLSKERIKLLMEITGVFLFYARAIDNTMLVSLGTLGSAQSKGTDNTMQAAVHLLNYAATHPDAKIRYHASEMQLHNHSDASYLSESEARSRAGGYFFLDGKDDPSPHAPPPKLNGPVEIICQIIGPVCASAAESEAGALFINGQNAAVLRNTLTEMGWPQLGPTPMQTDNSTAEGIANDTVKPKRTKAMDMRFFWVRDRVKQGQFRVHWKPGKTNHADYYTKHHPPSHHIKVRPTYLHVEQKSYLEAAKKGTDQATDST